MTHATEIVLREDANVLRVSGPGDIDSFTREYHYVPDWARVYSCEPHLIDWARVAAKYDAIIIAPYCYARRLSKHTTWYYGWDCASGCLWRARAVERLQPFISKAKPAVSEHLPTPCLTAPPADPDTHPS